MNRQYVPIIKCKKGEQQALAKLSEDVKKSIIPFIEIPMFTPAMIKKNITVENLISSFWADKKFFFSFLPEWYDGEEEFNELIENQIKPMCSDKNAIPVIDLSLVDFIADWSILSQHGVGIRLRNNDFGSIEEILNPLFDETSLTRNQVHLIFDLTYINENDLYAKISVLKAAFSDLDRANEFSSIIIASASFPKPLPPTDIKKIYRFKRMETEIYALCLKLAHRFAFNYIYADYGPFDISNNGFVMGMSPSFKIRYTSFDDYLYIRGNQIKDGGLDIKNVRELADMLINSVDYCGNDYSWGDKKIFETATGVLSTPGNLTTWVSYTMNHHITFIVNQI